MLPVSVVESCFINQSYLKYPQLKVFYVLLNKQVCINLNNITTHLQVNEDECYLCIFRRILGVVWELFVLTKKIL